LPLRSVPRFKPGPAPGLNRGAGSGMNRGWGHL
jgi:hypothetical protein